MTRPVRALLLLGGVLVGFAAPAGSAVAQADGRTVVIVQLDATSLPDLLGSPAVVGMAKAGDGGAALMVASTPGRPMRDLNEERAACRCSLEIQTVRVDSIDGIAPALRDILASAGRGEALVMVVSTPPDSDPRQLGAALLAAGEADELLSGLGGAADQPLERTLTSESTRRDGVITSADVATTAVEASASTDATGEIDGALIEVIDGEPPVDLYLRYLQQQRLAVPIGTVAGLFVTFIGVLGVGVMAAGRRAEPRLRSFAGQAAIAVVPLAVALLEAGHLNELTYAAVVPFLIVVTLAGILALVPVRRSAGPLGALAWLGAATLTVLAVESTLGWTAALTPLLGGSQLDGGRFFGLPNVMIGLLLGASLYVAQRLASVDAGVGLLAGAALFAGLPWTGSNVGAAITLLAAAGLWWGIRGRRGWIRSAAAVAVVEVLGVGLVIVAHRYLADAPTHISRFAADSGGFAGIWEKFVDRLGVGARLIADNPFALVPVIGVLATLWVVLRPPAELRTGFGVHPAWRDALVTILGASVIGYVANDSGAAAVGLGFGTALGGLLYVSLLDAPASMEGS